MEKILADIGSLYWWVSVVVVGIAINLISSFLKTPIDQFVEKWSITQREKRQLRNTEIGIKANLILADPRMLTLTCFEQIRLFHYQRVLFGTSIVFFALGFFALKTFASYFVIGKVLSYTVLALGFWMSIRSRSVLNKIQENGDAINQAQAEISRPIIMTWTQQLELEKKAKENAEMQTYQAPNPKP